MEAIHTAGAGLCHPMEGAQQKKVHGGMSSAGTHEHGRMSVVNVSAAPLRCMAHESQCQAA